LFRASAGQLTPPPPKLFRASAGQVTPPPARSCSARPRPGDPAARPKFVPRVRGQV